MANLLVRDVEDALVQSLSRRAAANERSPEDEHRAILIAALSGPKRRSFAEVLADMPDVGEEADFARANDANKASIDVFD